MSTGLLGVTAESQCTVLRPVVKTQCAPGSLCKRGMKELLHLGPRFAHGLQAPGRLWHQRVGRPGHAFPQSIFSRLSAGTSCYASDGACHLVITVLDSRFAGQSVTKGKPWLVIISKAAADCKCM